MPQSGVKGPSSAFPQPLQTCLGSLWLVNSLTVGPAVKFTLKVLAPSTVLTFSKYLVFVKR